MKKTWKSNTFRYSEHVRLKGLNSSPSSTRISPQIYCSLFQVILGDWPQIYSVGIARMSYLLPPCIHPHHGWKFTTEDFPRKISYDAWTAELLNCQNYLRNEGTSQFSYCIVGKRRQREMYQAVTKMAFPSASVFSWHNKK